MSRYVVDVNNTSSPTDQQGATQGAEEVRALKTKLAAAVAGAFIVTATGTNAADITTYIRPDVNDRPSMVAGGWLPWNLNQQWGGAGCMPFHMIDSATGVEFKFDAFDGYIEDNNFQNIGSAAGNINNYQGINPAKNLSLQAIWIKLYKVLNPIDNVTLQLWSVAAGIPNALIATANVINGKQITSDTNGQFYRFAFAAVQALVAGIQYVFVMTKSGGVDAANFYNIKGKAAATKYPNNLQGIGTAVPAWTPTNTTSNNFICEAQASDQPIQTLGQFAGRLLGTEGNPINRSVGYCKPLREFFPLQDPTGWSIHIRGKSFTKDRTFFEAMYGLHHDRINVRSLAATGLTTVTIYKQDGTVVTLSGTTDISTNTFKDIMIVGRSMGDGGDYLRIYVGAGGAWTKEAELTLQTFIFDPLMLKQGTGWIMGGFQLFKNTDYTKLSDMTILPSADGWAFTTTTGTVEGNVFAVSGGKLNQIKAGMAAGGDGYYQKAALALSNANGWFTTDKSRVISQTNTKDENGCLVNIFDGTKVVSSKRQEYYNIVSSTSTFYPQQDLKSADSVILQTGKGNDYFVFLNGKLNCDGTGSLLSASGLNQIQFGDTSVTANENADIVWDYVGYYNTSNIYPQFTAGELHEFAVFSGDKNLLGVAVYNLGVPLSLKQFCGIPKNYIVEEKTQFSSLMGITGTVINATTNFITASELEAFVLGGFIQAEFQTVVNHDTGGQAVATAMYTDGELDGRASIFVIETAGRGDTVYIQNNRRKARYFGLHKVEARFQDSNAVGNASITSRSLIVDTKAYS